MKRRFLSGNILKILALISMTFDHVGMILFPRAMWLRGIGRLAFPIFAFLISEGYKYTRNKLKYFLSMLIWGIFAQIIIFAFTKDVMLNILFTFCFSIMLIYLIDMLKTQIREKGKYPYLLFTALLFAVICLYLLTSDSVSSPIIKVDYGFWGIMLPVFAMLSNKLYFRLSFFAIGLVLLCLWAGGVQWFSLISLIFLALYSEKRGKLKIKYFFYSYYPMHLAILYTIALII